MIHIDKFGPRFGILRFVKLAHYVGATADTMARLKHEDIKACFMQRQGSRESGKPCPDDDDARRLSHMPLSPLDKPGQAIGLPQVDAA
jgi:hypothetical protein